MTDSGELAEIVRLTLQVSAVAVSSATLVGVPLGAWLGLAKFPGREIVVGIIHTGMALPPVVVGLLVYLLLSRSGPLGAWGWLYTPQAMMVAQFILALPLVVGITMHAVAAVPRELFDQLRGLGASPSQARRAILREARSGVGLAIATALGRSLSEVGAVLMVGGNIQGHTRVLTTSIVLETARGEFSMALALGAVLMTLALLVNFVILRTQARGMA
ncbi:MAG: ABC transporter permease [Planctomycetia bacterium]|nr:ABC transporter permease [Planctomycetia bacterium]